jgi:uncharacterized membrane protein
MMMQIQYLLTAIILVVLDGFYLNSVKSLFQRQIKAIQGSDMKINFIGAAISYVFIIFGLNYFIIRKNKSPTDAALLGLVIYAVYEFTNYALFDKWSLFTVFIDTIWGAFLFGLTTWIVYQINNLV